MGINLILSAMTEKLVCFDVDGLVDYRDGRDKPIFPEMLQRVADKRQDLGFMFWTLGPQNRGYKKLAECGINQPPSIDRRALSMFSGDFSVWANPYPCVGDNVLRAINDLPPGEERTRRLDKLLEPFQGVDPGVFSVGLRSMLAQNREYGVPFKKPGLFVPRGGSALLVESGGERMNKVGGVLSQPAINAGKVLTRARVAHVLMPEGSLWQDQHGKVWLTPAELVMDKLEELLTGWRGEPFNRNLGDMVYLTDPARLGRRSIISRFFR